MCQRPTCQITTTPSNPVATALLQPPPLFPQHYDRLDNMLLFTRPTQDLAHKPQLFLFTLTSRFFCAPVKRITRTRRSLEEISFLFISEHGSLSNSVGEFSLTFSTEKEYLDYRILTATNCYFQTAEKKTIQ